MFGKLLLFLSRKTDALLLNFQISYSLAPLEESNHYYVTQLFSLFLKIAEESSDDVVISCCIDYLSNSMKTHKFLFIKYLDPRTTEFFSFPSSSKRDAMFTSLISNIDTWTPFSSLYLEILESFLSLNISDFKNLNSVIAALMFSFPHTFSLLSLILLKILKKESCFLEPFYNSVLSVFERYVEMYDDFKYLEISDSLLSTLFEYIDIRAKLLSVKAALRCDNREFPLFLNSLCKNLDNFVEFYELKNSIFIYLIKNYRSNSEIIWRIIHSSTSEYSLEYHVDLVKNIDNLKCFSFCNHFTDIMSTDSIGGFRHQHFLLAYLFMIGDQNVNVYRLYMSTSPSHNLKDWPSLLYWLSLEAARFYLLTRMRGIFENRESSLEDFELQLKSMLNQDFNWECTLCFLYFFYHLERLIKGLENGIFNHAAVSNSLTMFYRDMKSENNFWFYKIRSLILNICSRFKLNGFSCLDSFVIAQGIEFFKLYNDDFILVQKLSLQFLECCINLKSICDIIGIRNILKKKYPSEFLNRDISFDILFDISIMTINENYESILEKYSSIGECRDEERLHFFEKLFNMAFSIATEQSFKNEFVFDVSLWDLSSFRVATHNIESLPYKLMQSLCGSTDDVRLECIIYKTPSIFIQKHGFKAVKISRKSKCFNLGLKLLDRLKSSKDCDYQRFKLLIEMNNYREACDFAFTSINRFSLFECENSDSFISKYFRYLSKSIFNDFRNDKPDIRTPLICLNRCIEINPICSKNWLELGNFYYQNISENSKIPFRKEIKYSELKKTESLNESHLEENRPRFVENEEYINEAIRCFCNYLTCSSRKKDILITLRILKLLNVNPKSKEAGHALLCCKKNIDPWKQIISQLFSHLKDTPEFLDFIKEITKDDPASVVFNALSFSNVDTSKKILDLMDPEYVENVKNLISGCLEIGFTIKEVCYKELIKLNMESKICSEELEIFLKTLLDFPESLNKADFMHKYWSKLQVSLEKLKKGDISEFKIVLKELLRHLVKDLEVGIFATVDASPLLAKLKIGDVPLFNEGLNIVSVGKDFTILQSKTRPRKISFLASDGHIYYYLVKCQDDLRLDQRMSNLLHSLNYTIDAKTRNYPVIPLRENCGIIKFVTNAVSMFSIYQKYIKFNQQNEIKNPTELWHKKAKEMKLKGIRREWPSKVFIKLYMEMENLTPKDLLRNELFCYSSTPYRWWKNSVDLSVSFATMSIIGHIIGLGDRHLENILIDFKALEVIHVDYNICFDKGKTLKIPETVPFRLTRNIQEFLNDGYFRQRCCDILSKIKDVEEMIYLMLESFLYDPITTLGNASSFLNEVYKKLDIEKKNIPSVVENLIIESTDLVNLSKMFEGWAAWI